MAWGAGAARAAPGLLDEIRPGDVVMIGDAGLWADLGALVSDRDRRYGHVGIAGLTARTIISASGSPTTPAGRVHAEPLPAFVGGAGRIGLYRPITDGARIADFAESAAAAAIPFDRAFDLSTPDRLYCTELVWRALVDTFGPEAVPERTYHDGRRVIAMDDLQSAPCLTEIGHLTRPRPDRA
jgi:hypothetical protein